MILMKLFGLLNDLTLITIYFKYYAIDESMNNLNFLIWTDKNKKI